MNKVRNSWMGYHVDEFLDDWNRQPRTNGSPDGTMEAFKFDFGILTNSCPVQKQCQSLQRCSNLQNPDMPNSIAAFLAYEAMVNLANYFNMLWSNINTAHDFNSDNIGKIVHIFYPTPEIPTGGHASPLEMGAMITGLASFGMFAIPGIGVAAVSSDSLKEVHHQN